MNTGWELGWGERAGEKDLVDTGGEGPGGGVMHGWEMTGGELDRGEEAGGGSPVGKRRGGRPPIDPAHI